MRYAISIGVFFIGVLSTSAGDAKLEAEAALELALALHKHEAILKTEESDVLHDLSKAAKVAKEAGKPVLLRCGEFACKNLCCSMKTDVVRVHIGDGSQYPIGLHLLVVDRDGDLYWFQKWTAETPSESELRTSIKKAREWIERKKPYKTSQIEEDDTQEYKRAYAEAIQSNKGLVVWVQANEPPGIWKRESRLIAVRLRSFPGANEGDYVFASNRGGWLERLETVHSSQINSSIPVIGQSVSRYVDDCPTGS